MPKGTYETVGDKQQMSTSPVGSPSADPKGGQYQNVGDAVVLNRTAITSPSANPSGGEYQMVGEKTDLNKTPIKGWGSAASLPMSKRAIDQSKTK